MTISEKTPRQQIRQMVEEILSDPANVKFIVTDHTPAIHDLALMTAKLVPNPADIQSLRHSKNKFAEGSLPDVWNIFISVDGTRAIVVHKEFCSKSGSYELPYLKGAGREWIQATWHNFIVKLYNVNVKTRVMVGAK